MHRVSTSSVLYMGMDESALVVTACTSRTLETLIPQGATHKIQCPEHLGDAHRQTDYSSIPSSEPRGPAEAPPTLSEASEPVPAQPPPAVFSQDRQSVLALIMACHPEQIPHMTSEIINTLRENFLFFFLIKTHNSFKEQENVSIVPSWCGYTGECIELL